MKEPYIEGVAIHDDPESCAGARKDDGEAFDRGTDGLGIEPRNQPFGAPTPLSQAEGHTRRDASASPAAALRGRRPHARPESFCTGTGRSPHRSLRMVRRDVSGRQEPYADDAR